MSFHDYVEAAMRHKWLIIGVGGAVIGGYVLLHQSSTATVAGGPNPQVVAANDALKASNAQANDAVAISKIQSDEAAKAISAGASVASLQANLGYQGLVNTNSTNASINAQNVYESIDNGLTEGGVEKSAEIAELASELKSGKISESEYYVTLQAIQDTPLGGG